MPNRNRTPIATPNRNRAPLAMLDENRTPLAMPDENRMPLTMPDKSHAPLDGELLRTALACRLFDGLAEPDVARLCGYLDARLMQVNKGVALYAYREPVREVLYISEGTVSLELYDAWGHRSLINLRSNGFLMGETAVLQGDDLAGFNLVTQTPCTVLTFRRQRANNLLASPGLPAGMDRPARRFCYNLAVLTADNLSKSLRRVNLLAQHSVRERLALFLTNQAEYKGSRTFTVNMNRQQLADYLSIDRSTLCEELSKMRREGLIDYRLNHFTLLER